MTLIFWQSVCLRLFINRAFEMSVSDRERKICFAKRVDDRKRNQKIKRESGDEAKSVMPGALLGIDAV